MPAFVRIDGCWAFMPNGTLRLASGTAGLLARRPEANAFPTFIFCQWHIVFASRMKGGSQQRDCPGLSPGSLLITRQSDDGGEPMLRAKVSILYLTTNGALYFNIRLLPQQEAETRLRNTREHLYTSYACTIHAKGTEQPCHRDTSAVSKGWLCIIIGLRPSSLKNGNENSPG